MPNVLDSIGYLLIYLREDHKKYDKALDSNFTNLH